MENIVLTIHLVLALALIAVVLLQRSEGGLGGLGGGGGGGGMTTGRAAASALSKVTWLLAIGFLITSLTLTILATRAANTDSVIERLGTEGAADSLTPPTPALPDALQGDDLTAPVPVTPDSGPAAPPTPE